MLNLRRPCHSDFFKLIGGPQLVGGPQFRCPYDKDPSVCRQNGVRVFLQLFMVAFGAR